MTSKERANQQVQLLLRQIEQHKAQHIQEMGQHQRGTYYTLVYCKDVGPKEVSDHIDSGLIYKEVCRIFDVDDTGVNRVIIIFRSKDQPEPGLSIYFKC